MATKLITTTCPKCKTQGCAMISLLETATTVRQVVFDACTKCGTKTTDYQEFQRDKTPEELVTKAKRRK